MQHFGQVRKPTGPRYGLFAPAQPRESLWPFIARNSVWKAIARLCSASSIYNVLLSNCRYSQVFDTELQAKLPIAPPAPEVVA